MTPKEKAEDLFKKMNGFRISYAHRKKCALIVVDEIISSELNKQMPSISYCEWWKEVKEEINKLGIKK